ncbi:MAG TPA: hypothetical protein VGG01_17235 [Xanthobacteraceae bacterium]
MTRTHKTTKPQPAAGAKSGDSFLDDFRADWQAHGKKAIELLRAEKPSDYVRIAASVLAKEANHAGDPLDDLNDAELADRIAKIAASIGLELRPLALARGAGEADADGPAGR